MIPIGFLQLPRVRKVDKGFKVEHDTSERDAAVMGLIEQINARLRAGHARPQEGGGQGVSFAGPDEF